MDRYYKVDIRRLPLALLWRWGYRVKLLICIVRKALPLPWFATILVPAEPVVERVSPAQATEHLVEALAPASSYFAQNGFQSITYYSVPNLGPTRGLAHALLSSDGKVVALCIVAQVLALQETAVSLVSLPADGPLIGTGSKVRPMPAPPDVDSLSLPGASPAEVFRAHATRVAGTRIRELRAEDVVPLVLDLQARANRYYVGTHLYVPATDADVEAACRAGAEAFSGGA
jgi:hypothetical protein